MAAHVRETSLTVGEVANSDTEALLKDNKAVKDRASGDEQTLGGQKDWSSKTKCHRVLHFLKVWWRSLVVLLTPILLLPIPIVLEDQASRAAYVIAIMAVYWVTEVVPLAVTALLPLILFPALGVLTAREAAVNYLNDNNMLFTGGLMVAVAIEKWDLHRRIALSVLMVVGTKPRWLLLGFMGTTAFLSMWISNTATSAMMLPIAQAVLIVIRKEEKSLGMGNEGKTQYSSNGVLELSTKASKGGGERLMERSQVKQTVKETGAAQSADLTSQSIPKENESNQEKVDADKMQSAGMDKAFHRLAKVLMLGVAYSANIGGTATLPGTVSNIVLSGDVESLFPASPGINFGLWFAFAFPAMLLALFCTWLYLSLLYCDDSFQWLKRRLGRKNVYLLQGDNARRVIQEQYKKLGTIRYSEIQVLVLFVVLALLWLFREPGFVPGWGKLFSTDQDGRSYVSDSSTVLFIVFLLFLLPSKPLFSFSRHRGCHWRCGCLEVSSSPRLLDWETVQHKFPWDILILLGSGFALAAGAQKSCLSAWIGGLLLGLQKLPKAAIALLVSVIVASVTEVISNVATTTLFLPVLAQLAVDLHINPLYLMIPAAFSASFAFMLPVATPSNAIAFSYGYIRVVDMVATGVFINIMCVGIVSLALNTTGVPIFGLGSFPDWANSSNLAMDRSCSQHSNTTNSQ